LFNYNGDQYYIWGAQLEVGNYPTSYIPTTSAAVTRNADAISKTGISSLINSTEGVLFIETKGFVDTQPNSTYIQLSKNGESGFNNSLVLAHRNNGLFRVYANGSITPDIQFNLNIDFTENHKIAVLYKLNGYKLFIDGVAQNLYLTPTQVVFSGLDNLSFDLRGSQSWNAKIKNFILFPSALSDTELTELTTL
jgi:histidinol phosphatase-like PHP family hydrolase